MWKILSNKDTIHHNEMNSDIIEYDLL